MRSEQRTSRRSTYPRNVQAFFSAALETTGALTAGVTLVASRNAGATWEPVSLTRMRAQTSAAAWRSTSGHGVLAVNAGDAVRFGLSLHREGGTATSTASAARSRGWASTATALRRLAMRGACRNR